MNNSTLTKNTIFLSLGSNIGDKKQNLETALNLLREKIIIKTVSSIYESKPYGFEKQDNFYNQVLKATTSLSPESLLFFCKFVEETLGRKVTFKNGPRIIDIDILLYNNEIIKTDDLVIPHPELQTRDFVLVPLLEIEPQLQDPIDQRPMQEFVKKLKTKYILSRII